MRFSDVKKDNESLMNIFNDIKKVNEKLNAVISMADIEAEIQNTNQDQEAPLYKIPVAIKDNISTKGLRTTASSKILDNYVPIYDATVIKKLREAGAVITCKSSMDELGMGGTNLNAAIGKCNNPYDLERITGGSSGGSAALVASGLLPLALGTDTGDSIRKPAGYCGVVGVKPTYGRISRYGVIPYASSLDHVGYFTSNVKDAAKTLEILAGRDDLDMTSSNLEVEPYAKLLNADLKGKKIGIIKNVQDNIKNEKITNKFNELIEEMKNQGAIIEEVVFNEDYMNALLPTYLLISNAEATANHSNLDGIRFGVREEGKDLEEIMINSRTKGFSSDVRKRFVIGSYSLFVENQEKLFRKAQKTRRVIVNDLKAKLDKYDCLIASSSGSVAPLPQDSIGEQLDATYLVAENHMLLGNFSGYPSITLPNGLVDDLPVGVNLLCKPFRETEMFSIALGIENITKLSDLTKRVVD